MYDVLIIGSGPAGYVAAERAGEMGKKALLVERAPHLGGVCLNSGCIPTKAMLHCAKSYDHAIHAESYGVTVQGARFDYATAKARAEGIQETLRGGIQALMKKNKAEVVTGEASLASATAVRVGGTTYEGKHILLCTGSRAAVPPIPGLRDNPQAMTHIEMLQRPALPEHLVVIGGGVIGTEFATLCALAGKRATVIEMLPDICGETDKELSRTVRKALEKKGVVFHLGATVTKVAGTKVSFSAKDGTEGTAEGDALLVAAGRSPNVEGLGLETLGVEFDRRKGIRVDERARTNVPGVYAAGDVTGRWQLAHFASRQATVAIRNMFGGDEICREEAVPAVVYSDPEIASVGLTEDQAKARGVAVKTAKFPLTNNGRYLAETEGERAVCKAVFGAERGELLGMHLVGPHASEMIAAAAVMIEMEMRAGEIGEIVFPHPTISEALRDIAAGLA